MKRTRSQLQAEFVAKLTKRWEAGAREYGDGSFFAPPIETVEQILAEVEDVAGWAFVLWVQLRRRLTGVVLASTTLPDSVPACPKSRTSSRRKPARSSRRSRARN